MFTLRVNGRIAAAYLPTTSSNSTLLLSGAALARNAGALFTPRVNGRIVAASLPTNTRRSFAAAAGW